MRKIHFYLLLAVCSCLSCPSPTAPSTDFVCPEADWRAQDFFDSQGIASVENGGNRLVLTADLAGQDPEKSNGEIVLDLRYFSGLEGVIPLDLRNSTVTATVCVPRGFAGSPNAPNGVQVFVKDEQWRSCYGLWHNVIVAGHLRVDLRMDAAAYVDPGFDPARICVLGVKFGINSMSWRRFEGTLYVEHLQVTPHLSLTPPPPLPSDAPPPDLVSSPIEMDPDGFLVQGQECFLVGANVRLIEYGQNFGATAWFPRGNGVARHPNFLRTDLDYAARAGIKIIRVGLLDDGRTLFDADANVTGYSEIFREDVRTLLDMALGLGLRVEFTLVDYLIAGKPQEADGVLIRGRAKLLQDPATHTAFLDDFLVPFLDEFGGHAGLFGFDIINEPEWIVSVADGGGWEDVTDLVCRAEIPIPLTDIVAFTNACADAIHQEAPGKFVTLGTSCPFLTLTKDMHLDYIAPHHYPWMGDLTPYLFDLPCGMPWMLEEYPTRSTPMTITDYLTTAVANGAAGAYLWNLSPEIDTATFTRDTRDTVLLEIRQWVDTHNSS